MQLSLKSLAVPILFALLVFFALQAEQNALKGRGQVRVQTHPSRTNTVILSWSGEVEAPMTLRFQEAVQAHANNDETIIIDLNSNGGALREGSKMITWLQELKKSRRIETQIRSNRYCLSMCVPIYLEGQLRRAAGNSKWMFHEPRQYDSITDEVSRQPEFEKEYTSQKFFNRYFVNSEIDADWRERLRPEWEKGKDIWFTGKELFDQRSNIVQELM